MQSEELLEKAVRSAMLSVIKEHPMGHWRDDQVKEVARRAIVEAALSAAEPVAIYKGNGLVDCGDSGHHNVELLKLIPANTPLYAAPPAPSVVVKALVDHNQKMIPRWKEIAEDGPDGNEPLGAVLRALEKATAALSAQVQDVVGWQPIETAPKDGTPILGGHSEAVLTVWWEADGSQNNSGEPGTAGSRDGSTAHSTESRKTTPTRLPTGCLSPQHPQSRGRP